MRSCAIFLSCLLLLSCQNIHAQDAGEDKVFTIVEEMPEFPPEYGDIFYYIFKNIQYPEAALQNEKEGRVYVNFVVDTNGVVTKANVLRGLGDGCDEEALRLVNNMPKWIPGKQNGQHVKVAYNLPVEFSIQTPEALRRKARRQDYDLYKHGVSLIKEGKFYPAVQDFDMLTAVNPVVFDAYYNRGVAKFRMRDTAAACLDWGLAAYYGDLMVFDQLNKLCDSLAVIDLDTFSASGFIRKKDNVTMSEFETELNNPELPQFVGGPEVLGEFIARNIRYPGKAREYNITGRVYIRFYVSSKGKVCRPYLMRDIGEGCGEEALRVVKLMPDWKPGIKNGKPAPAIFNLPVNFTLK